MVNQNSIFGGMLTTVGAAKKTNCDALGVPWQPSHMLIGDANGTDPVPNPGQTKLINQVYRAPLNQLYVSPTDPNVLVAELVLPPNVGGWWIRELALEDVDGVFSAVANCAPSYKPLLVQNSGRNQVVRMHIVTSGTANIQLKIDPSVVLATREFVTEELAKQDFKHSVLVATTGPIVLNGLQTIDAVALPAGAAVLVKDQVAAKENGIYVVSAGAWTRRADADASSKVTPGLLVHVEKGTINGDGVWQLVTEGPINLGVSVLAFEMAFGRTGVVAGTYRSVTVDKYGRVVGATNPTTVAGYGLTDVYTKTQIDQALAAKAPLASPEFTGTPKAPTAAVGTNNEQLATTAFVQQEIAGDLATTAPLMDGTAAVGTSTKLAREDHRHPTDTTRAPLASPALTGTPTAPTAAAGTNNTQLANTAFVQTALAALVASSPAALDTLNELAAALGNDPNFATTITNLLAGKQPLDSDLTALAALTTVGFYVNTGVGSVAARSITAGTGVSVANGNGVAGNPVVSLSASGVGAGSYSKVTVDALGRVTAGSNPTTLAGAGITDAFTKTESNTAIQTAIESLVASSPAALDTLNELAAALGDDPNFATTMTTALAAKAPLASPTFTGTPKAPTAPTGTNSTQLASTAFVQTALAALNGTLFGTTGQTLKNMTASRAKGVTYTNSKPWPIIIMLNVNLNATYSFKIDSYAFQYLNDTSDGTTSMMTFVVPAGSEYSLSGWADMYLWLEFS